MNNRKENLLKIKSTLALVQPKKSKDAKNKLNSFPVKIGVGVVGLIISYVFGSLIVSSVIALLFVVFLWITFEVKYEEVYIPNSMLTKIKQDFMEAAIGAVWESATFIPFYQVEKKFLKSIHRMVYRGLFFTKTDLFFRFYQENLPFNCFTTRDQFIVNAKQSGLEVFRTVIMTETDLNIDHTLEIRSEGKIDFWWKLGMELKHDKKTPSQHHEFNELFRYLNYSQKEIGFIDTEIESMLISLRKKIDENFILSIRNNRLAISIYATTHRFTKESLMKLKDEHEVLNEMKYIRAAAHILATIHTNLLESQL